MIQNRYVVECHVCPEKTFLPHRSRKGESRSQLYWPKDEVFLVVLCNHCEHLSSYIPRDIPYRTVETDSLNAPPSVFWKAVIECDHENCGKRFSVHTRTEGDVSKGAVGSSILNAKTALKCSNGHIVLNPRGLSIQKIPESAEE